jgi:hypothetical protein
MPAPLVHVGATAVCPHGGQITFSPVGPSAHQVLVGGFPVITLGDLGTVTACAFTVPGPGPQPCLTVQWFTPATRILVNGRPPLLMTSSGQCQGPTQAPQGPPTIVSAQTRCVGT